MQALKKTITNASDGQIRAREKAVERLRCQSETRQYTALHVRFAQHLPEQPYAHLEKRRSEVSSTNTQNIFVHIVRRNLTHASGTNARAS